jgi:tRNA G18 (ribose-2'-O)-methylase SpoU
MIVRTITSLEDRGLEPYATLRGRTDHPAENLFVAESEKVVRQLLESRHEVVSLLLSPAWLEQLRSILEQDRFGSTEVYVGPESLLRTIVGYRLHQNVMALGRIGETPPLDEVAAGTGIHIALEGVTDAENVGMIVRNAAAFGAATLLVGPDSASPYLRRSVRVSLGTVFCLRVHRSEGILAALSALKERHGWHIVGTSPRDGRPAIRPAPGRPLCLLFGSEAHGLTPEALRICDALFSVPLREGVDSLNVANAVAVALWEATRLTAPAS